MPRLLGKLPAYRRHKATGQAVVTLGGKDYYLGPWKSVASRNEYQRVTREWLVSGGVHATADLSIVELLAALWLHAQGYYVGPDGKPTSEVATYRTLIDRFKKLYGRTFVAEFGPLKLKAFRQSLVDEKLSRTVINRTISRVRQVLPVKRLGWRRANSCCGKRLSSAHPSCCWPGEGVGCYDR
jgi:hypothetical protein